MKFPQIFISILFLTGSMNLEIYAQTTEGTDSQLIDTAFSLPPLSAMIDSAMKTNAMVRFRALDIVAKEANLKSQRSYWVRNLSIQANLKYGTFDNFSTNSTTGESSYLFNTVSNQLTYWAGLYLQFPIYDIFNRKNQIVQAKAELDEAKSMVESQRDDLRQLVIKQYNDLLLKQKLLYIRSKNLGNARVNMEMVEKEFHNGVLPVVEYARIADIVARIESDYETARSDFLTSRLIFEDIVGFRLNGTYTKKNHEGH
jgi:outer membrane protein TolC